MQSKRLSTAHHLHLDDDPSSSSTSFLKRRRRSSLDDSPSVSADNDDDDVVTVDSDGSAAVAAAIGGGVGGGGNRDTESTGFRLLGLLLQCAECVGMDNLDDASNLLPEIAELSSPFESSAERVAAYFADGLSACIVSSYLGTYAPLAIKSITKSHNQKLFNALQSYIHHSLSLSLVYSSPL